MGPVYGVPTSPAPTYGPPQAPYAPRVAEGHTAFPPPPSPSPPARSSLGLVVLGLGLGLLAMAVIGVAVGYAVLQGREAPPTGAIKPNEDASLASKAPDNEPDDEPTAAPTGTAGPKAPVPPSTKRRDAGALDASVSPVPPSPSPTSSPDASVPPRVTRVMSRSGADMSPYGMAGGDALAAFDATIPSFRPCAPLACLRMDKIVRDEPWLSVDARYEVTTAGTLRFVGFSPGLPSGPSCPAYEACIAARTSSVKMPKPEKNGVFSVGILVVERPVK